MLDAAENQPTVKCLEQINVIRRFFHSSSSLMTIVGEKNSGKTELLANIVLQMRESRPIIRLEGKTGLYPSQLVDVLSKHWAIHQADKHQRVETQLDEMIQNLSKHTSSFILIIDDAHLLSLSVLAAISHLVTQQEGNKVYLHILLSGQPILAEKINSLLTKEIPRLTLGALSREEAFRKIKRQIDNAGLSLPPAAANAVFARLYRNSEGMPQTLENMVEKLISQHTPRLVLNTLRPNFSSQALSDLWRTHRIKVVSLFSLLTLGCLFWTWQHHHLNPSASSSMHVLQRPIKNVISPIEGQRP